MKKKKISNESGFTILEVFIAATVFITGFTVMVLLLDTTISRFSNKDFISGTNIAQELMLTSMAVQDTTGFDSVMTRAGIDFKVSKKTAVTDYLVQITIIVQREKTKKKVIELYNEFLLSKKQ